MEDITKVSDELSVARQITPKQLQQVAQEGFQSVLNLRFPDEANFLNNEAQLSEAAGLHYANIPLRPTQANQDLTDKAIQALEDLPKPVLIHCAAGARASGIALIVTATQENLTYEQVVEKARELGISLEQPHLRQFLLEKYSNDAIKKKLA